MRHLARTSLKTLIISTAVPMPVFAQFGDEFRNAMDDADTSRDVPRNDKLA
jgi:hypothetical protein